MLTAVVYAQPDGYHVAIRLDGIDFDDAGPFDWLEDAVDAARRAAEDVEVP